MQAVVVTYNRKALLIECLEALARQTHRLERVLVVDNASTDGTLEALEASGIAGRVPVDYLRLKRNGGGAEGFHYGVREALRSDTGWIWLMDDDCEPTPACLADLLAHPRASDPGAALVAPLVEAPGGDVLPLNRGWVRARWFRAPLVGLAPEHYGRDELEVDHVSLVGPLVRTALAAREEPPRRDGAAVRLPGQVERRRRAERAEQEAGGVGEHRARGLGRDGRDGGGGREGRDGEGALHWRWEVA